MNNHIVNLLYNQGHILKVIHFISSFKEINNVSFVRLCWINKYMQ